ncbi:MAG: hypothetical protein WCM93_03195 [Bacteroidota bacterium]
MQKIILLIVVLSFSVSLNAQTWKVQIQRATSNHRMKTLKIRPDMHMDIGSLLLDNDTLKESKFYNGFLVGGGSDSIKIRLNEVKEKKVFTNGINKQATIPAKYYLMTPLRDSSVMKIAISDIDYLSYYNDKREKTAGIVEPIALGALFVMALTPLISYDFKEGKMNAVRYKNWALGSTICLAASISFAVTVNSRKKFQFKTNWPDEKGKVWSFK